MGKKRDQLQKFAERFGDRLATLRAQRHLTQERLAELLDVGATYVAKLETGTRKPSFDLVCRIAQTLGFPARELFNFDDDTDWQGAAWEGEARQFRELLAGKPAKDVHLLREIAAKLW